MLRAQLQSSARNNSAGHSHPKYDQLIEQIGTTIDPAKRAEMLNEFYRAYFEAVPYALTWNEVWIYASNNKLQGFAPYPNLDLNSLKTATLKE
jgi:ABC-type transport system substrate-binding protein